MGRERGRREEGYGSRTFAEFADGVAGGGVDFAAGADDLGLVFGDEGLLDC